MRAFRKWCDVHLIKYRDDIRAHGADWGCPGITTTAECVRLYDKYEESIWSMMAETAEALGQTVRAFIFEMGFDDDLDQFKNAMLWEAVCAWADSEQ
jgi:hypothetical protein